MKLAPETAVTVRLAEERDLDGIVRVHLVSFQDYFLTHLGRGLVKRYYQSYLARPEALTVVADGEEGICGFIIGTPDDDRVLGSFYRRHFPYVSGCVLRQLLMLDSVIWKGLAARLSHVGMALHSLASGEGGPGKSVGGVPATARARLLSIAILPEYRGGGCSSRLLRRFELTLKERAVQTLGLSVNSDNARAIRFYLKEGWTIQDQDGEGITFSKQL
jgi:ribosomal protein S18 acetylase RimI-like enzyme